VRCVPLFLCQELWLSAIFKENSNLIISTLMTVSNMNEEMLDERWCGLACEYYVNPLIWQGFF